MQFSKSFSVLKANIDNKNVLTGGQHGTVLQSHTVLPGLQAPAAERPAASTGTSHGSYASCHVLHQGGTPTAGEGVPAVGAEPQQ